MHCTGLALWVAWDWIWTQIDCAKKQSTAALLENLDGQSLKRICGNVSICHAAFSSLILSGSDFRSHLLDHAFRTQDWRKLRLITGQSACLDPVSRLWEGAVAERADFTIVAQCPSCRSRHCAKSPGPNAQREKASLDLWHRDTYIHSRRHASQDIISEGTALADELLEWVVHEQELWSASGYFRW